MNPTREEVFGMVNIESLACGTPVITFNSGGSPETINESCGRVVACDDVDSLICQIKLICKNNSFTEMKCRKRARHFEMNVKFQDYINLYENIVKETEKRN